MFRNMRCEWLLVAFLVTGVIHGCATMEDGDAAAESAVTTSSASIVGPAELENQSTTPACEEGLSDSSRDGQPEHDAVMTSGVASAAGRCPIGCYEANVACTGFVLWNACFCWSGGQHCPAGGWWVAGGCLGGWQVGCLGR